ncbi:CHAD domain-containing protein [Pseudaminobacter soli (ex Li et al. 2025)]|uniref:Metal-binding protein n=1 Tax=Pseudaminobacter soli (ex Li et al. 2025) TaxID=1295366 RepID=A0A2P7SCF8_9HYPH|nr:CHAD domain-containing protein [Mesorhizobium soli]PSJ60202.1 metal-binding protein [Mesorhizobium soli]
MNYCIDPHSPLTAEVRRIASEEVDAALEDLTAARTEPEVRLHECRKHLKRLRALYRLVRSADQGFFRAENARFRDVAHSLAGGREATALIETVDRLAKEFPEEACSGELAGVRKALVSRRDALLHPDTGLHIDIEVAIASCQRGRAALAFFKLPDKPQGSADLLAKGAKKAMRKAGKALAAASKNGTEENFHELRKAVKAHWMQMMLLTDFWPPPVKPRRKEIDLLGEHLGELNDLAVMRRVLVEESAKLGSRKEIALLERLIKRSEKRLRKQSLVEAADLFEDKPGKATRKLAKNYKTEAKAEKKSDELVES